MEMDSDLLAALIIGFCIGVGMFVSGLRSMRLRRIIEDLPRSKVASIAMGLVELHGTAQPAPKLKLISAPITAMQCLYYRYTVEEYRRSKNSSSWVTIDSGASGQPFCIKDDTGDVLVDPVGAEVDIASDYQSGQLPAGSPYMKAGGWLGGTRRYTEYRVMQDDPLFVIGTAADNPHVAEGTAIRNHDDIMIHRGPKHLPFLVADTDEKGVLGRQGRNAYLGIILGSLLILGTIAIALAQFGLLY